MSKRNPRRHSAPSLSPESGAQPASPDGHLRALLAEARLSALSESELLDTPAEEAFDRFTRLASKWLNAPVALVSLVDDHRQFFKSAVGLPEPWASLRETPLNHSFCQYGVTTAEPLIVMDARQHPWLEQNLAISELGAVAYAGMPLVTSERQVLGMFCVIDSVPRTWSEQELATLRELAAMVGTELELRARVRALKHARASHEADRILLRSVLDCMEDAVVVTAEDGSIVLKNEAAQRSLPRERTENSGIFLVDGVTPLNRETRLPRAHWPVFPCVTLNSFVASRVTRTRPTASTRHRFATRPGSCARR
ncbi:MAG TPA: GAF domain-containing protein [Polyangiaceae bacterium]|nr:GAF domain-containing protein [Polyangiaceae bacterium]